MLAETETPIADASDPAAVTAAASAVLAPASALTTLDQLAANLVAAEAVWERESDRTDSVKADNEGRAITEEDEAIWSSASDAHWAAVDALTAYRPRSAQEFLRKATLLTNDGDTRLRSEEQFAEVYLADAQAVAQMGLDATAALPALRSAWDAALARFDLAQAEYERVDREWDELHAALTARAPVWNRELRACDGKPLLRYHSLKNFDNSQGARPDLRAPLETWLAVNAADLARFEQLGTDIDAAYDRVCDIERALIETPAPDLAAVIYKQRLFGRETDDDKKGYADPAYAAAKRDASYVVEAWPLWIHEDVLRLAGVPDPLLTTEHFKPRHWKSRFESAGGKVSIAGPASELKIDLPNDPAPAAMLLAELAVPGATETLTRYLAEFR